jgi:hypothetical protein
VIALGDQVLIGGIEIEGHDAFGRRGGRHLRGPPDQGPGLDAVGAHAAGARLEHDVAELDDARAIHAEVLLPVADRLGGVGVELARHLEVSAVIEPQREKAALELSDVPSLVARGKGPVRGHAAEHQHHGSLVDLVQDVAPMQDRALVGDPRQRARPGAHQRALVVEAERAVERLGLDEVPALHRCGGGVVVAPLARPGPRVARDDEPSDGRGRDQQRRRGSHPSPTHSGPPRC